MLSIQGNTYALETVVNMQNGSVLLPQHLIGIKKKTRETSDKVNRDSLQFVA